MVQLLWNCIVSIKCHHLWQIRLSVMQLHRYQGLFINSYTCHMDHIVLALHKCISHKYKSSPPPNISIYHNRTYTLKELQYLTQPGGIPLKLWYNQCLAWGSVRFPLQWASRCTKVAYDLVLFQRNQVEHEGAK